MAYLPPATTFAPREDWDDGDFELPSDRPFHTPSSRQTSFASSSHTPLHNSSRPSFSDHPFEEDDMAGFDDIEDLDDGQGTIKLKTGYIPSVPVPNIKASSAGGKAGFISLDSMKAMQASAQFEKPGKEIRQGRDFDDAFEEEDGFGNDFDEQTETLKMPARAVGLPLRLVRPVADKETDWDEFDAMMDEDERESTLKAGSATLKGLRDRFGPGQPFADKGNLQKPTERKEEPKPLDDGDLEADFALPLTLEHLKLANKKDYPSLGLRHRSSRSSLITNSSRSDWDRDIGDPHRSAFASPSTSSTSITSASMPVTDQSETDIHSRSIIVADEIDDFENDFVLPTPSFFSSGQSRELNNLLDRKRKAHPPPSVHGSGSSQAGKNHTVPDSGTFKASRLTRATISSAAKSRYDVHEEAFEDGLVLEEEGAELNQGRLSRLRKARLPPATPSSKGANGTLRKDSGGSRGRYDSGDLFRERKTSGKVESPEAKLRKTDSGRVMVDAVTSSPAVAGPSTPHRLRTQKSHSRLNDRPTATPGPAIAKKQSLASLRDAMAGQQADPPSVPSYVAPTASSVARQAAKSRERFSEAANQPLPSMPTMTRIPSDHGQSHRQTQTVPVSASKGKSRPALGSAFNRPSSSASNPSHSSQSPLPPNMNNNPHMTIAHVLKRPKTTRTYGDGTELDVFDDLMVDRSKESFVPSSRSGSGSMASHASSSYISGLPNSANTNSSGALGLGRPSYHDSGSLRMKASTSSSSHISTSTGEKRKKPLASTATSSSIASSLATPARKERKKAGLIRHLGKLEKKQVGEMTWNPQTLRWEGNYGVLREFDNQLASSVRPALIAYRAPQHGTKPVSPVSHDKENSKGNAFVSHGQGHGADAGGGHGVGNTSTTSNAVRVVGNMMFDPEKMCWMSTLPQEEEDPDPFEGLADDEDDFWQDRRGGAGGGTITRGTFTGLDLREPSARAGSLAYGRRFISDVSTAYTATPSSVMSRSQHSDVSDDFVDEAKVDLRQGRNLLSGKLGHPSAAELNHHNNNIGDRSISLASSRIPGGSSTDYDLSGWTWVDEDLYKETRAAERRHAQEMKGWYGASEAERMRGRDVDKEMDRARRREEKRLWEIRHLVMDG